MQRISQAEINISHKIKESKITSEYQKSQLLGSLIKGNDGVEIYTDSKQFLMYFKNSLPQPFFILTFYI